MHTPFIPVLRLLDGLIELKFHRKMGKLGRAKRPEKRLEKAESL